jgi:hypothetical protein
MDIGTGTEEDVRVIVDGKVRLVFHPDGSVEWHCAHSHAAHDNPDNEYSARICTKGCWHGKVVGEAELAALDLEIPAQTTVGHQGDADKVPNKPEGYLVFQREGQDFVVPYFKAK